MNWRSQGLLYQQTRNDECKSIAKTEASQKRGKKKAGCVWLISSLLSIWLKDNSGSAHLAWRELDLPFAI